MSEAKFTKGEWMVVEGDSLEKDVVITNDYRVDSEVVPICEMDVYFDGVIGVEQSANAHLIACAPEMYAMLESIISAYEMDWDDTEKVIKLLAKARGAK